MKRRFMVVWLLAGLLRFEAVQAQETVRPIAPARQPLPPEDLSASVSRFSFIVYGDSRGRIDRIENQYEHSLVVEGILAAIKRLEPTDYPVRFIMQTGDAVFDGGDVRRWNTSFVALVNRLTTEGGVPYYLAPGNHDVTVAEQLDNPQRQQGLRNYLEAMSRLLPPDTAQRRLSGYPTYAFGYGNTFVVTLDSNIANDPTQYDWVKGQLEGLDRKRYVNVVAMFHHPVFSSGPHGGAKVEAPSAALRSRYMPLFRVHHVKLLFTGHDHLFEHWVESYVDGSGPQRMDMVVTGGGGAPLYAYSGEPDLMPYLRSNEAGKVQLEHLVKPGLEPGDNPFHFVVVRVDGGRIDMEVIGVDWGSGFRPYRSNKVQLRDSDR